MSSMTTHGSRRRRSATLRCLRPRLDHLDARVLLSATPMVAHPTFELGPLAGDNTAPAGYAPAQIQQAYGFNSIAFNGVAGTGSGETIAIVDAYDDPNIQADLNTFDSQFGLPTTTVMRVTETGGTSYPGTDPTGGWETEESLDVEWAHAMAPGATIMLVEASSDNDSDLANAVSYAESHANVVSMSWGLGEFAGEPAYDSAYFDRAGVAFVASSGDNGAPPIYPAISPNVLAVGGTTLTLGPGNVWSSETGWSGSGGGLSRYESQPSYQTGVVTQSSSARANPDVAYDADPNTGVAVYDSFPYEGVDEGWVEVGGTSEGAPQWAALLAIADQGRAASGQPPLDSTNPQQVMDILYQNPADFHAITSGTSDGNPSYSAGPGYNLVTGLGSPMANLVVGSLVGAAQPTTLAPIASQSVVTGQSLTVTLQGTGPNGLPLTYAATAETQLYWLKSTYGFYEDAGGYYTNFRGQMEEYLRAKVSANGYSNGGGDFWYYILPNGDLYEFTPPYTTTALTGALVADVGVAVYNNPSLLWNASNVAPPVTLLVSGNQLTITPNAGFTGVFYVTATDTDGYYGASQTFQVNVIAPPTLAPIASQFVVTGQSLTVTLQGTDPNGLPLTYGATALTQLYWLKSTYGFYEDAGGYYTDYRGQQEEYLRAKVSFDNYNTGGIDPWYYILPNGSLYEFTPPYTNPNLVGALVAQLGTAVYNNPSLLWNASNVAAPVTLGIAGSQLTITPNAGFTGVFYVTASDTDGYAIASQTFQVTVIASNAPPTLAPIASQTVTAGQSLTVTLQGTDPNGLPLTYGATALTQLYWLNSTYGFYEDAGGYYTNYRGQMEEYLRGKVSANGYSNGGGDFWYYILPDGDLYEFTPPYTTTALTGALVADVGVAVYDDPSLLWNASNVAVPVTLLVSGNQLTITPNTGFTGVFYVIATATDGYATASRAFQVTVTS